MDIAPNRWDTADHDPCHLYKKPEEAVPERAKLLLNWHGEMFLLEGSAAADVERTFWQRWHDPAPPVTDIRLPPYNFTAPNQPERDDGLPVQVVRTFGCPHKFASSSIVPFWGFVPKDGEFSGADLFYKAVAMAKKYILMADQFLNYPQIFAAVERVLPQVERVILVTNRLWWLEMGNTRMRQLKFLAIKALLKSAHFHKVSIFTLASQSRGCTKAPAGRNYQIYMHAKTVMVDDKFLLTGSMGLERAGFTNDHEVAMGIYDPLFVSTYRRKLSAEYLQLDESDPLLHNYSSDFAAWDRQAMLATEQSSRQESRQEDIRVRLRRYKPVRLRLWDSLGASTLYGMYEPDGRCG